MASESEVKAAKAAKRGKRPPYNPKLDRVFATYKARDEKLGEGIMIQLVSYDGHEPRCKVTRYYRDDRSEGEKKKWVPDTQRIFPRFRIVMLTWLLTSSREMDRGYDLWAAEQHKSRNRGAGKEAGK